MTFRAEKLAVRLLAARRSGRPLDQAAGPELPDTLQDGYAVQAAAFGGEAPAGFKIALTSSGAQAAFGADGPVAGRLGAADIARSPAHLASDGLPKFAEAELAFIMAETLDPAEAPFSEEAVRRAVGGVHAAIELCASRYAWDEVSLPQLTADNANAWMLVVGEPLSDWRGRDLADIRVRLRRAGHASVDGAAAAVLGDPVRSLAWLANWLAAQGDSLKAGQIVASGSCTGITALSAGREEIRVEFDALAQARAIIEPMNGRGDAG